MSPSPSKGDLDERIARRLVAEAGATWSASTGGAGSSGSVDRSTAIGSPPATRSGLSSSISTRRAAPRGSARIGASAKTSGGCASGWPCAPRRAGCWPTATASRGCSASPAAVSPIGRTRSPIPSARSSTRLAGPGAAACATPSSPGPARDRGRSTRQRSAGSSRSSGVRQPPPNDRRASRVAAAGSPSSSNAPTTAARRRRDRYLTAPPVIGQRTCGSAATASAPGAPIAVAGSC